jgi:predicted DNA-binding protein
MARNYEALVQVGFRTKKEVKEKISESANKAGKGVSEYLANIIENVFNSKNDIENVFNSNEQKEIPLKNVQETLKNDSEDSKSELANKLRTLFLELSLSYPLESATPMEMVEQLLNLAKKKKIKRVKDW